MHDPSLTRILRRFPGLLDRAITALGGRITLVWDAAPAPGEAQSQASYSDPSPHSEECGALLHFVKAESIAKQMLNFHAGDAIVTFAPRTILSGKRNLYFILRSRVTLTECSVISGQKDVACADTTGLNPGALVLAPGVLPPGARVEEVSGATHFTLTLPSTVTADDLIFVADMSKDYVQAQTGRGLEEWWDVHLGGQRQTTTLLLRLRGDSAAAGETPPAAWPAAPETTTDEILVVDGDGTATAYRWDGAQFLPESAAGVPSSGGPPRAQIVPTQSGIEFRLGVVVCARYTQLAGLVAAEFTDALPQSATPRMEFRLGGTLVAALTQAGTFAAVAANDGAQPEDGMAFRDALGRWLFTIGAGGITAPLLTA